MIGDAWYVGALVVVVVVRPEFPQYVDGAGSGSVVYDSSGYSVALSEFNIRSKSRVTNGGCVRTVVAGGGDIFNRC